MQEGKAEEPDIDLGDDPAQCDADGQAEHARRDRQRQCEFHVMPADRRIVEAQRLCDSDLGPLLLDDAQHRRMQQEDRDAKEDRRHQDADGAKLLELAVHEGVRKLPGAAVNDGAASVGRQQPIDCLAHRGGGHPWREPHHEVVETIAKPQRLRQRFSILPDDGEAAIVGHDLPGPKGEDELGRERGAGDGERPPVSADRHRQATARAKTVRFREACVDHDLVGTIA